MKYLLRYLRPYLKETILAPALKMTEALIDLFVPLVIAGIIDIGIGGNDRGYIIKMSLLLVLLAAVGLAISITAQYFAAKASVCFSSKIRSELFRHIQSLSYTQLDTLGQDTLITRMTSDVNQVQNGLNLALRLLLRSPFIVFGAMIMAFFIDVKSALIFAVVIPVLSLIVFGIMRITSPMYKRVQGRLDRLLVAVRENLTGVRVLRAFRKEKDEVKNFESANDSLVGIQKRSGLISALTNPLTYVVINLGTVALIYTGALRVDSGDLTQGQVVALYNYIAQILIELVKLANLIVSITKALACADRISDILNEHEPSTEAPAASQAASSPAENGVISFNDVSFTYRGAGAESLSHVSFNIGRGETVGIIGGTGSGKSTLADLMAGFYKPTQGTVFINGLNIDSYDKKQLLDIIGVVPQKSVLFRGTIRDNMRYAKENATDEEINDALKTAQAFGFVYTGDNALDAAVEQGGRNFSGGQRQRLAIARTLVKKPDVLILDDSSSALDYATDAALRAALKESLKGMTVIIVSQRAAGIMHADRILVMDDGLLKGCGTHEELLETCGVYRDIFYSQFPEKRSVREVTA